MPPRAAKYRSLMPAERLMARKMAKNTIAAPVSPCISHRSMGTRAWQPSSITWRGWSSLLPLRSTSRCLAKVRIKAIFTSSEDWKVLPAMLIHALASTPPLPTTCSPKKLV